MERRALIIYCDDTGSDKLAGPSSDNINYREFLQSRLGGDWSAHEICSLRNPDSLQVKKAIDQMDTADYTFTVYSGHGYLNVDDRNYQYFELKDKDISIFNLGTKANRQTLIVDACRGYYSRKMEKLAKAARSLYEEALGSFPTREIFDRSVLSAEEGWTVLYAASENQSALDTDKGGAYLLSLLECAELWKEQDKRMNILDLKTVHSMAVEYIGQKFITKQRPTMNAEKRRTYFPFAVKTTLLHVR